MTAEPQTETPQPGAFLAQVPLIEPLIREIVETLALAAHAYLSPKDGEPDVAAAGIAVDVAGDAFERVKERLRPQERLALTQVLTEMRLAVVRKR